ncbi:MAG: hypothetical protein EOP53_25020, partial [Sphingobacteriales bacterium]
MKYALAFVCILLTGGCKNNHRSKAVKSTQDTLQTIIKPTRSYQLFIADCKQALTDLRAESKTQQVQDFIYSNISKKMPGYWDGTVWDFNGTTRKPGEGSIACGYFITTILEDIGLKISRIKMAQE